MRKYEIPEMSVVELTSIDVLLTSYQVIEKGAEDPGKHTTPIPF